MNYTSLIHAHKGIIYLFIFVLVTKVVLLLVNEKTYDRFREKTRITEMILGPLVLFSGFYLLYQRDWHVEGWLAVKIALVFLAIPLAIVGLKKKNKVLATLSLLIFIYVFVAATNKSLTLSETTSKPNVELTHDLQTKPYALTTLECATIHGKTTANNYKTLSKSSPEIVSLGSLDISNLTKSLLIK